MQRARDPEGGKKEGVVLRAWIGLNLELSRNYELERKKLKPLLKCEEEADLSGARFFPSLDLGTPAYKDIPQPF